MTCNETTLYCVPGNCATLSANATRADAASAAQVAAGLAMSAALLQVGIQTFLLKGFFFFFFSGFDS